MLVAFGILERPITWFTEPTRALWAVIFSITWKVVGFGMILFVASIQSIDREITEAALIDGAGYWQRVQKIILPLSYRTILLATLISVTGSMLAVDQFIIMTGGDRAARHLHLSIGSTRTRSCSSNWAGSALSIIGADHFLLRRRADHPHARRADR